MSSLMGSVRMTRAIEESLLDLHVNVVCNGACQCVCRVAMWRVSLTGVRKF